ncbi:MAG: DcaP family trimeric outer membrane transporter [Paracoccus sp. (in: a-proteobacteria)]|uniref:DcaP family trimeric outer membrane transporter n=1 Tax=Paracoccus sp. TaxID=267 RepID=UPI0039E6249F
METGRKKSRLGSSASRLAVALAFGWVAANAATAQTIEELNARVTQLEKNAQSGTLHTTHGVDLTFYGFVRADMYTDSKYDMGNNSLGFSNVNSLTEENAKFGAHAYQTRFGVRGSFDTVHGEAKFNFEGDFYGGGGGSFRIRQAYGELAGFVLGQTWSNAAALNPATMLDFDGVMGGPGYRTIQGRYTAKLSDNLAASFSIEDDPLSWKARPVITGALTYTLGEDTYKFAAMSRGIDDLNGNNVNTWNVVASASVGLWEGGKLNGVISTGKGYSSIVKGGAGIGQQAGQAVAKSSYDLDANGDPIGLTAYAVGISHTFSPKFTMGFSVGLNDYDDFAGSTEISADDLTGAILTARYTPSERVLLGLEYQRFERKEFGGAKLHNDRLLAVAQFNF